MKERIIAVFLFLLAALTVCMLAPDLSRKEYARPAGDFSEAVRNGTPPVAEEVIRLHILADSDSTRDQTIKLALRDALLPYLNAATLGADSKEEAFSLLENQCPSLTRIANDTLEQLGADYTATVSLKKVYFPIRIYGSQTYLSEDAVLFPPGFYDSVQIVLGNGEGHNWWCLAYPSLCFIDSAYDYIPKESEEYKIKIGSLSTTELKELFYKNPPPEEEVTFYFGFKILKLFQEWFDFTTQKSALMLYCP